MRWVGTSWKMNKTRAEARSFASRLASALSESSLDEVQPFVIPPYTAIDTVVDALGAGCRVVVGAQNVHWEDAGAWTGEVSAPMLADAGVGLVEIGHSERRAAFAETDETVARKVAAALRHGLRPLICVGEPGEVFASGRSTEFVLAQARAALREIEDCSTVLLAYEPIWAIGEHGREPDRPEIETTMVALRNEFVTGSADPVAGILYGGSVNETNAAGLLDVPGVDGLFVGRAAWDVEGYLALLTIASSTAGVRTRKALT